MTAETLTQALARMDLLSWEFFPEPESAIEEIAAVALAWVAEQLTTIGVREKVAAAISANNPGWGQGEMDFDSDAEQAIAAIRDALT